LLLALIGIFRPFFLSLKMRVAFGALAMFHGAMADNHIVLAPKMTDPSLPEKMMLFIPGGGVPNARYVETALAIQEATTQQRLWVTIPSFIGNLCIPLCPTSAVCSPLHVTVEKALSMAVDQGWNRGNDHEDLWLGGHSLGGVCANSLYQAYGNFAGLVEMASYVDKSGKYSVANYPVPVLTLNAELGYGGDRPGKTSVWWKQHLDFVQEVGEDEALKQKPVVILPGLNHSDFCPGFDVPGDLPAEVDQATATGVIAEAIAAFFHAQTGDRAALTHLRSLKQKTHLWMDPYLQAEAMENTDGVSSFCESAAHIQGGLSAADDKHVKVTDTFQTSVIGLENCHTAYEVVGSDLQAKSCSHTDYYLDIDNVGYLACSKQISCKMLSSQRITQELKITAENSDVTCRDINMQTVQMVEAMAPKVTLERFKQKGRGWCFEDDSHVFGNVGPLWMSGDMKQTETADCMSVSSLALWTDVNAFPYPGNSYCKLLSPTRVLDWMMTDSLKPFGGSTVLV